MSRRMGRSFAQRMAEERRVEAQIQDLADKLKSHANVKSEVASEHRVEQMRRERLRLLRQAEERQGAILEQKLCQEYEAKILDEQQTRLVAELQHRKSQQASEEAKVRRFCEQSEELRALSEKLQAAQMNKDRHSQIQHNLQMKKERLEKELELQKKLAEEREQAERWEKQRVQARHSNMGNLKEDLDKQILDLQRKKKAAYIEFLKEKAQVDEVVQKVLQKEQQAEEEKRRKRAELREMIHQYEIERRNLKHRLKEEETSELNKIQEWTELQERRLNEIAAKKSMQQQLEAAKYDLVASGMERQRKDQEEMEQLLIEMFIAEADAKIEEEMKAREARRLAQRQEMIDGQKQQQILAERKRTEQKAQEQALRTQMMAKFAEDDRIDQMNAERARRAKIEHHRAVQKMLEDRRALFEKERDEEMREREREMCDEEERVQIVERERERMLREHARKLREYLPRGVVRNEKDKRLVFGESDEKGESTV